MNCDNCGGHEMAIWTTLEAIGSGGVYAMAQSVGGLPLLCTDCRAVIDHALASRANRESTADAEVLDVIDVMRRSVGMLPMTTGARTTKKIAARRKAGATQQDLLDVVQAFGKLAMRDPSKRSVLNAITPFTGPSGKRNGGWHWGLQLAHQFAEESRARGVVPKTVAEIEQERGR